MKKTDCAVDGCERPRLCKGFCSLHYQRYRTTGDPLTTKRLGRPPTTVVSACIMPGCDRKVHGHGLCKAHHLRFWRYGDPSAGGTARSPKPDCCIIEGCGKVVAGLGLCRTHYERHRRHGDPEGFSDWYKKRFDPIVDDAGYVHIYVGKHPNAKRNSRVPEHRYVMSQMLGRPLRDDENVHHRNGVRADNRPENLELWVVSQPSGQRVGELVSWARALLERYPEQELALLGVT